MSFLSSVIERVRSSLLPADNGPRFLPDVMDWVAIGGDNGDVCLAFRIQGIDGPVSGLRLVYDAENPRAMQGSSPLSAIFHGADGTLVRARLGTIDPRALLRIIATPSVLVMQFDDLMACHLHQAMVYADPTMSIDEPVLGEPDGERQPLPHEVTVVDVYGEGVDSGIWEGLVRIEGLLPFDRLPFHDRVHLFISPPPPYDIGSRFTVIGTLEEAGGELGQIGDAVLTPQCRLEAMTSNLNLEVAASGAGNPSLLPSAVAELTMAYADIHAYDAARLIPYLRDFGSDIDPDRALATALSEYRPEAPLHPEVEALLDSVRETFG